MWAAMSRKVILAWELGGGLGHTGRLVAVSKHLRERGFDPVFALQRPEALEVMGGEGLGDPLLVPSWPGLLPGATFDVPGPQATLGDSLADLGLARSDVGTSLL